MQIVDLVQPKLRHRYSPRLFREVMLLAGAAARQLLEHLHHPILIEAAVAKVRFGADFELELTTLLGGCRVDTCRNQTLQMVVPLFRVNNMDRFVATLEPIFNERKQNAVLLFVTVKKRAHMTCFVELGASKRNGGGLFSRYRHSLGGRRSTLARLDQWINVH